MILQILALLVLALGAGGLAAHLSEPEGARVVIIVDTSASMGVMEGGTSRFEIATREVRDYLEGLSEGARVMLVSSGAGARIIEPFTTNREALLRALDRVELQHVQGNLAQALRLAGAVATAEENEAPPAVFVVTDGALPVDALETSDIANLRVVSVGKREDNVGIVGVQVRRSGEGNTVVDVLFTIARQTGAGPVVVEVRRGESLLAVKKVEVGAGLAVSSSARLPEGVTGIVDLLIPEPDGLAQDNRSGVRVDSPSPLRVLLVTPGNEHLMPLADDPRGLALSTIDAPGYQELTDKQRAEWDAFIFDRVNPKQVPARPALYFAAVPPDPGWSLAAEATEAHLLDYRGSAPFFRSTQFADFKLKSSHALGVPTLAESLMQATDGSSLMAYLKRPAAGALVCAFDVHETNLPYLLAFPILLHNVATWFFESRAGLTPAFLATGEVVILSSGRQRLKRVTNTRGGVTELPADRESHVISAGNHVAGLLVESDDASVEIPVNLLSHDETTLRLQPSFETGAGQVEVEDRLVPARRSLLTGVALVALGVLATEWLLYHRRG